MKFWATAHTAPLCRCTSLTFYMTPKEWIYRVPVWVLLPGRCARLVTLSSAMFRRRRWQAVTGRGCLMLWLRVLDVLCAAYCVGNAKKRMRPCTGCCCALSRRTGSCTQPNFACTGGPGLCYVPGHMLCRVGFFVPLPFWVLTWQQTGRCLAGFLVGGVLA